MQGKPSKPPDPKKGVFELGWGPICQEVLTKRATTFLILLFPGLTLGAELPEDWPAPMDERCETEWPASETTTQLETELCARYWLKRYVYGNQQYESIGTGPNLNPQWLRNGHYNGREVETILTSTQIRGMLRHLKATMPGEGLQEQVRQRTTEYLEGALRSRFTLSGLSGMRLESILPELTKVVQGQRLVPKDLVCRTQVTLWKLEAAVFARHGSPLSHPDLHTFFYGKRTGQVEGLRRTRLLPMRQDSGFTPESLTTIDSDNLKLLSMVGDLNQQTRCHSPESWGIATRY